VIDAMTENKVPVWTPAYLHQRLAGVHPFAILDVRNEDEFAQWKIEGKAPLQSVNIPYFELLDLEDENEEVAAAVARAVPRHLKNDLPMGTPVLVVCAQGDTSPHVAEGLRRQGYEAFNLEGGMAAWGNHYEVRPIVESTRLTIIQISRPAKGCLSYVVASGGEAVVVDAARHTDTYMDLVAERGWRVKAVIDSHLQADHVSGGGALARSLQVDYMLHPYDAIHPEDLLPATFPYCYLEDEAAFTLGEVTVRPLHVPGHTLGMVNLLVDGRYLLSGDALFINSVGRPDLAGRAKAWAPLLYRSLQRLLALPDDTTVLPAHFGDMNEADERGCYCASLGILRSRNQGLRRVAAGKAGFIAYVLYSLPEHPPSYDKIRRVNIGLLQVDEVRASELELGKNRCALSRPPGERRLAA
jgi:glyoxylase-like metal-dependent hydrolase (beta-lactamase superfamily II)/rhodanese-related sulfurtransferase